MSSITSFINDQISINQVVIGRGQDFTALLPDDVVFEIFSHLKLSDLGKCCQLSKKWQKLASNGALRNRVVNRTIAFGKDQWEKYFGDIGKEPPLPKNIYKILNSPCPFWKGKKVFETHMLVLVPKTIDGKPLTLNKLGELVKKPKNGGYATQYRYIWDEITKKHGDNPIDKSSWVLMTTDVIDGRAGKTRDAQLKIAPGEKGYQAPKLLEAATCVFMKYVSIGEKLFTDNPRTYTCCQEMSNNGKLVVGGFTSDGLFVSVSHTGGYYVGVAGLRKFC